MKQSFINQLWKLECEGWKYLYASDRYNDKIPNVSGIYCIVMHTGILWDCCNVVYVGKSKNFASRLKPSHPIESKIDSIISIYIMPTKNFDELEIDFIKRYKPHFNIQHNG